MDTFDRVKRRMVGAGLDHLYEQARGRPLTLNFDRGRDKLVCVSDLHRGRRDGADDFRRTERVYNAALAWYHENGYRLAVLGDAEDLWEHSPREILGCTDPAAMTGYARSLALERRFNQDGRYLRLYGNHDRLWASKRAASKWLEPHLGKLTVHAAIAVQVTGRAGSLGEDEPVPLILLTHGDAGTLDSAVLAPVSKMFVHFWAFWQKKIGAMTGLPADDWNLRETQDRWMQEWAARQRPGVLLITGHTHRPVFAARTAPAQPYKSEISRLEASLDAPNRQGAADLARGEFLVAEMRREEMQRSPMPQTRPCYFNTGACCFGDGDMTAIEIVDGEIRLMRWAWHPDPHDHPQIRAHILESESLRKILGWIQNPDEAMKPGTALDVAATIEVLHDPVAG